MRWTMLSLLLLAGSVQAEHPQIPLVDTTGQVHRLGDEPNIRATVVVFLMPDCPLCQRYAPTLNRLAKELPPRVAFYGVVTGNHNSTLEIRRFAQDYQFDFPILLDRLHRLTTWLKPTHAPEAFIIQHDGTISYRGRIDNWYAAPGKPRSTVTEHDLRQAIQRSVQPKRGEAVKTEPVGCSLEESRDLPESITYQRHIAPLLRSHCVSCHRPGEVAPFSLLSYNDAAKRGKQLLTVVESGTMPPWKVEPGHGHFSGERRLSDVEKQALRRWVDSGTPAGSAEDELPPAKFSSDWHLGPPDLVIKMPEPFTIPASGQDILRNFVIPIPEANNQWVVAMEFRPGNRKVVHHALCLLDATGQARKLDEAEPGLGYDAERGGIGFLPTGSVGGWAPGIVPRYLPEGMGRYLAKGSDLVLQIHYHPSGKEEQDQSELALYFSKKPVSQPLAGLTLENWHIDIPPGEPRYQRTASYTLPVDVTFVGVAPHMHLLGKEMRAWAKLPTGETKPLVYVKDWDFNWQDYYVYREPFTLPKGTMLHLESFHDNSEANAANPHRPVKRIKYGEGTNDEMSLCIFEVTTKSVPELYQMMFDNIRHNQIIERFSPSPKKK